MNAVAFFIYLAQVCLYAGVMWGIYYAVWRGKPLLRGSRVYLLISLVLPLVLPLIRLPVPEGSRVAAYSVTLPEVVVGNAGDMAKEGFPWATAGLVFYAACAALLAVFYLRSYVLLFRKLSRGISQRQEGYTIITDAGIGPGTIGKRIFFPASDVNEAILRHELGHVHAGHRYDGALMQLLHVALWISPAHWLIRRELKLVHEYEADRAAVGSVADVTDYGKLMLSQSLGANPVSISHSFFHHPLKLRIKMLQLNQNPKRRVRIYTFAAVLIILFSGVVVIAQTKKHKGAANAAAKRKAPVSDTVIIEDPVTGKQRTAVVSLDAKSTSTVRSTRLTADTITMVDPATGKETTQIAVRDSDLPVSSVRQDGRTVYKFVEKMPSFNGDLNDWLSHDLKYPDAARKANQQGRSVVQFIVNADGSISDAEVVRSSGHPLLDVEALRAVNAMPRWNPGGQAGQPVPVYFTLPITFKLDK